MAALELVPERQKGDQRERRRRDRKSRSEERPHAEPLHDNNNREIISRDTRDCREPSPCARAELERRHERLSRARRPRDKRRRPRAPRQDRQERSSKENEDVAPPPSPRIDTDSPTYRHLGWEEPVRSIPWPVASEPVRDHHAANFHTLPIELDQESEPQGILLPELPHDFDFTTDPEKRIEKINKRIQTVKRKVCCAVGGLECAGAADELRRLRLERRLLRAGPARLQAAAELRRCDDKLEAALASDKPMRELVLDIDEWLRWRRTHAGRPSSPSRCSRPQLCEEKRCVQRALLRLEAARGRPPAASADRGLARPLYQRYRRVKRMLQPVSGQNEQNGNGELATILENEALLFTTVSLDSSTDSPAPDKLSTNTHSQQEQSEKIDSTSTPKTDSDELPSSTSSAKSTTSDETNPGTFLHTNQALHCLPADQLLKLLQDTKHQKSLLRRSIKNFEEKFEIENARKFQKDDREHLEQDYSNYKIIKARMRLLTVLLSKQNKNFNDTDTIL